MNIFFALTLILQLCCAPAVASEDYLKSIFKELSFDSDGSDPVQVASTYSCASLAAGVDLDIPIVKISIFRSLDYDFLESIPDTITGEHLDHAKRFEALRENTLRKEAIQSLVEQGLLPANSLGVDSAVNFVPPDLKTESLISQAINELKLLRGLTKTDDDDLHPNEKTRDQIFVNGVIPHRHHSLPSVLFGATTDSNVHFLDDVQKAWISSQNLLQKRFPSEPRQLFPPRQQLSMIRPLTGPFSSGAFIPFGGYDTHSQFFIENYLEIPVFAEKLPETFTAKFFFGLPADNRYSAPGLANEKSMAALPTPEVQDYECKKTFEKETEPGVSFESWAELPDFDLEPEPEPEPEVTPTISLDLIRNFTFFWAGLTHAQQKILLYNANKERLSVDKKAVATVSVGIMAVVAAAKMGLKRIPLVALAAGATSVQASSPECKSPYLISNLLSQSPEDFQACLMRSNDLQREFLNLLRVAEQ